MAFLIVGYIKFLLGDMYDSSCRCLLRVRWTRSPEPTGCDPRSFGALSAANPCVRTCKHTSLKPQLLMTSSEADLGVSSPGKLLHEESVKGRSDPNRSDGSGHGDAWGSSKSSAANLGCSLPNTQHFFWTGAIDYILYKPVTCRIEGRLWDTD